MKFYPRVIPSKYMEIDPPLVVKSQYPPSMVKMFQSNMGMRVIISLDTFPGETGIWLHASCSYTNQLPRWKDLKELFMGDRVAVQILPPKSSYLNIHPYCLHLFSRLDGETVPERVWKQP